MESPWTSTPRTGNARRPPLNAHLIILRWARVSLFYDRYMYLVSNSVVFLRGVTTLYPRHRSTTRHEVLATVSEHHLREQGLREGMHVSNSAVFPWRVTTGYTRHRSIKRHGVLPVAPFLLVYEHQLREQGLREGTFDNIKVLKLTLTLSNVHLSRSTDRAPTSWLPKVSLEWRAGGGSARSGVLL